MKKNDVVGGLVLIGIGLVFLASNLGMMPLYQVWRLWPVALIVIGAARMLFPEGCSRLNGLPLLMVGGVFLAHNYGVMHIRDSWPLFVVSAGISILAGSWEQRSGRSKGSAS